MGEAPFPSFPRTWNAVRRGFFSNPKEVRLAGVLLPPRIARLATRVQEIAAEVVAPRAAEVDAERRWPDHTFRAMADAGLLGLVVPETLGGLGEGLLALAVVTETLGRACGASAICYGMHCVGTAVIAAKPTDHHRERYLRPIARGTHVTTLALSEPGTGVHFYLPTTELIPDGESYLVRGTKHFVTSGGHADSYVVSTRATDAAQGEFTALVVDRDTEGVTWSGEWNGFGMRGNSSILMHLGDARVPRANLLGEEGDQIWYVFEIVAPYFLVAMAGTYLGIAQAALDYTLDHVRTRTHVHGGETLARFDVVQHRVGVLWARLEAARHLLYAAATSGDAGEPEWLPGILSCKAEVADASVEVVNESMTLCGGIAYRDNGLLPRLLRDVRASQAMAPTTDLLRLWTGRSLLGQPLL